MQGGVCKRRGKKNSRRGGVVEVKNTGGCV